MDLEREKGITILAKNTGVRYLPADGRPGHHQHHRHPRPRRLRRRGGARPDHGRRRGAAGRRQRGPAAADPVRAAQGAQGPAADHPGDQQGGPARRPDQGGRGRHLRALPRPRRRRGADRLPDRLRLRPRRHRLADPARRRHGAGRQRPPWSRCSSTLLDTIPAPVLRRGRAAAGARHQPRRLAVPRPAGAVPGAPGHHPQGPDGGLVPHRRHAPSGSASPSC